jgi:hypothetical protein
MLGQDCVTRGTAMPDIGAASGDNTPTAIYYFPDRSGYDLSAESIVLFQ